MHNIMHNNFDVKFIKILISFLFNRPALIKGSSRSFLLLIIFARTRTRTRGKINE